MKNYDVYQFDGPGYQKLFHHQNWRISILNYIEELELDQISYVESHEYTDEAFILLDGSCMMFFAEVKDQKIVSFSALNLEKNKVYNIHTGTFHTHTLSLDAKLLIIEEENTCDSNSPRIPLNHEHRFMLKKLYLEKINEL
ncbi:MAG: hypothetical protein K9L02_03330 [Acholeplasmataceae bacterium]|nr:hypothetical protein [Acholeplasmataceae bacterium]